MKRGSGDDRRGARTSRQGLDTGAVWRGGRDQVGLNHRGRRHRWRVREHPGQSGEAVRRQLGSRGTCGPRQLRLAIQGQLLIRKRREASREVLGRVSRLGGGGSDARRSASETNAQRREAFVGAALPPRALPLLLRSPAADPPPPGSPPASPSRRPRSPPRDPSRSPHRAAFSALSPRLAVAATPSSPARGDAFAASFGFFRHRPVRHRSVGVRSGSGSAE